MNLETSIRVRLSLFLFLGLCLQSYSQPQTLVGLNFNSELFPEIAQSSIGPTLERRVTRHSGGEAGLYYRIQLSNGIITHTDASGSQTYSFTVSQRYLTLPVLYKYYSRVINFSAGPTLDFFLGWKQKEDEFPYQMKSYDVESNIRIGFLTKVSKVISLSEQFVLEPEIRFGSIQSLDAAGLGIGIAGKYRF